MKATSQFNKNVIQTLNEHYELNNKNLIIGFSGGVDSVALLLWLVSVRKTYNLTLTAVHINHKIRKEADSDENFCRNLCNKYNVDFQAFTYDIPKLSIENKTTEEETGRNMRTQAFNNVKTAAGADAIALAHHMEDRAETILHNIIRGSGLKGMSVMTAWDGRILRPFINLTKDDLKEYVINYGETWVEDKTNEDNEYTRNYLRNVVIKDLENINSNAMAHICMLGDKVIEAMDALDGKNDTYYKKQEIVKKIESLGVGLKDITSRHIDDIIELENRQVGKMVNLPRGIVAVKTYTGVEIKVDKLDKPKGQMTENHIPESKLYKKFNIELIDIENTCLRGSDIKDNKLNKYTKYIDYDIIKDSFVFRYRKNGDIICLVNGQSTKLKDYFINEKIPRELRDDIALVAVGNEIVWAVGYRLNVKYYVTDKTKRVLKISYNNLSESL